MLTYWSEVLADTVAGSRRDPRGTTGYTQRAGAAAAVRNAAQGARLQNYWALTPRGVTADGRINLALKFRMSPTTAARAARGRRRSGGRGVWRFRWRRA